MIRNILILSGFLASAAFYTYYMDYTASPPKEVAQQSVQKSLQQAPSFSFLDVQGKTHTLGDYNGRGIVLNFWATWCAPCVVEMPRMFELAGSYPDTVFMFLSVDERQSDLPPFLKRFKGKDKAPNIIIGWDRDKRISQDLFQTYRYPETYLIDDRSRLSEKIIGLADWHSAEMREKVTLLSGQK